MEPTGIVTLRLTRAIVAGYRSAPVLNTWFERAEMTRRQHLHVDLGVAVDTADGLLCTASAQRRGTDDARDFQQGLDELKPAVRAPYRRASAEDKRSPSPTLAR